MNQLSLNIQIAVKHMFSMLSQLPPYWGFCPPITGESKGVQRPLRRGERLLLLCLLLLTACSQPKEPMAESGRTQRTENLLTNLKKIAAEKGYLFGHQDSPMYGVGWCGDADKSDIKEVTSDYPALMGFDLGHLELGDSVNLDGVPFDKMHDEIIKHFERGGMITISWHLNNPLTGGTAWVKPDSLTEQEKQTVASVLEGGEAHEKFLTWLDKVADFINSLETDYGVKVPVLFRPWHEHTGSWFWWGQDVCTKDQYIALWRLTVDRLKEKGVTNALYSYSAAAMENQDEAAYMERYPGDDIIDLLGIDHYCYAATPDDTVAINSFAERLDQYLDILCRLGRTHEKAVALTEAGYRGIPSDNWWTHTLMPVLNKYPIAYALVWRNDHKHPEDCYAPYVGQQSASDFIKFYNDKNTLFMRDINGLYL